MCIKQEVGSWKAAADECCKVCLVLFRAFFVLDCNVSKEADKTPSVYLYLIVVVVQGADDKHHETNRHPEMSLQPNVALV